MTDFRRDRGPLGPPPLAFRFPSRRRLPRLGRWWILAAVAAGLIALYIVLRVARDIYAELLWFDVVGYRSVYAARIATRVWLFFAGGGAFFALFLGNIWLARRLAPAADDPTAEISPELADLSRSLQARGVRLAVAAGLIVLALLISLAFAATAAGHWQQVLLALQAQQFGVADPQFNKDLGFYVFRLPIYQFAVDWTLTALIVTTLGALAIYAVRAVLYGFRVDAPRPILRHAFEVDVPRGIKLHISALIVAVLLVWIGRYYLSTFNLVYSTQGVDSGAFYTDIHANLPILYALMAIAGITAILVVAGIFRAGLILPLGAVGAWIVLSIAGAIYPAIIQNFIVQPNELEKEQPYLVRNVQMTRYAYGLAGVDVQPFPANTQATEQEVAANQPTIDNVRLWDTSTLRTALQQLQTIRPLFNFLDADVDRYTIDGQYRQVMLSTRELDSSRLPADAQTWVNSRLQFTHGYGYAAAAVNQVAPDGSPQFIESNIPLQGSLSTSRPEVYFGEQADHYIIVDSKVPEFTPTGTGENVQTKFQGGGGIRLSSLIRRAVFAWKFGDRNLLISSAIDSNSSVVYRRNIQQRIGAIAPFLRLDRDPYLVVDQNNLYWVQDAYTTTDRIPYSHPLNGVNYIRNSVKVVVDAYSGETTFYAVQPDEPVLKAYAAVYPHLFTPIDRMPATLRAHLRYPEDMFSLQARAYLRYHITDPQQFYRKEDQWDIPTEILGSADQPLQPYYVIARLPGGSQAEEFMLILPFVPLNRTNAIAWLAARSDGANYGKLVSYRFPSTESVPGPTQVERRIDSDARVSQQLTLWNQSGSRVIRGNLLMIPIGSADMFFEPLFLAATGGAGEIPQLKRVVVVNGDQVVMEPTLSRAIDVLFGRAQPSGLDSTAAPSTGATATPVPGAGRTATPAAAGTPAPNQAPPVSGDVASLVSQAQASYDRAQQLLRAGDFSGYGTEIAHLKAILDRLTRLTGATPTVSP
jgi:uncharacterized membrane protein (UPF0182 family)